MIYFLEGNQLVERKEDRKGQVDFRPCLALLSLEELELEKEELQLHRYFLTELFTSQSCKFESHEGFDYISLSIPDEENLRKANHRVGIYYRSNLLVFVYEKQRAKGHVDGLLSAVREGGFRSLSLERILFEFFDKLTSRDSGLLAGLEQEIFQLEEKLLTEEEEKEYIPQIIDLRRRLLVLKRYYEQMMDISAAIEENQNDLLSGSTVRVFHILTSRIDRLMDGVANLRDYISQVREAYQAQVDIRQNQIMKLFTVITAIFLPLTLIAGWYGMNLKMPEFQWSLSYPAVILASVLIALMSILYFKKNRWF